MIVNIHPTPKAPRLQTLQSGHVYKDNKGNEMIFIGFGSFRKLLKKTSSVRSAMWNMEDVYLYIKKSQLDNALTKGFITRSLDSYNKIGTSKTSFFSMVYFSHKSRIFVEDLGELYPPDMFEKFFIEDFQFYKKLGITYYWNFETHDVL